MRRQADVTSALSASQLSGRSMTSVRLESFSRMWPIQMTPYSSIPRCRPPHRNDQRSPGSFVTRSTGCVPWRTWWQTTAGAVWGILMGCPPDRPYSVLRGEEKAAAATAPCRSPLCLSYTSGTMGPSSPGWSVRRHTMRSRDPPERRRVLPGFLLLSCRSRCMWGFVRGARSRRLSSDGANRLAERVDPIRPRLHHGPPTGLRGTARRVRRHEEADRSLRAVWCRTPAALRVLSLVWEWRSAMWALQVCRSRHWLPAGMLSFPGGSRGSTRAPPERRGRDRPEHETEAPRPGSADLRASHVGKALQIDTAGPSVSLGDHNRRLRHC